jgi:pantoate--beta-alanine ligase
MPHATATLKPPAVVTSPAEVHRLVRAQQAEGKRVGLVPTMGALHAGHLSLVERSLQECNYTVVSIFVNPKQFSPQEDFAKYPRLLESDLSKLAELGVPLVFNPAVAQMYPAGYATQVEVSGLTEMWEGVLRPGHFRGVTTVVLKLFQIAPADRAYFGRKDYQQALVIRKMVADLNLPIEIVVCPLVRDADGLALSSRNAYLSPDDRRRALTLPRALQLAHKMFSAGERSAVKIRDAMRSLISAEPELKLDYVAVVDPQTLIELTRIETSAVALVAAPVGTTHLIDNEILGRLEI